ncbi:hypothetical protein CTAYLR_006045 [Chrysophaeum taylorii]|uniref:J domain-containing protein n=1 Tax=Chrysophaeum taylorii TaxID=2483200 RepID=A0AAD7XNK8_9STRA|nr:hypothetical protein CTAYLR_006045 [Chrysophaeum taylorii]
MAPAANPKSDDYYAVLGLPRNASPEAVKKAYKKCAVKYHPDKNPGDKEAEENFKRIAEAFSVLSDTQKRAAYDRFGKDGARVAEQRQDGGSGVPFTRVDPEEIFRQFFNAQGGGAGFPFAQPGGATFFFNGRPVNFPNFRRQTDNNGQQQQQVPEFVQTLQQVLATVPPPILVVGGSILAMVGLRIFSTLAVVVVSQMPLIMPAFLFAPERMRPGIIIAIILLGLLGIV